MLVVSSVLYNLLLVLTTHEDPFALSAWHEVTLDRTTHIKIYPALSTWHSIAKQAVVRGHSTPFRWPQTSRRWSPMVVDTPFHPVDPKLPSIPSKSILLITTSPYYKYLWMDHSWPPRKLNRSNSELDPSKIFSLNFCLSLYFMFSSCFILKLSATYIVQLYPSRDLSFSFRIPC